MQIKKPIELSKSKTEYWMYRLLDRAHINGIEGEVPVAAVILNEFGQIIGFGRNTRNRKFNPLGHAELIALRQASWLKRDWRFNECTLIVTLEPCQMCSGALVQARMGKVIFGARDFKRGGLGGSLDLSTHISAHHKMTVEGGVLEEEVRSAIENWFKQKRMRGS